MRLTDILKKASQPQSQPPKPEAPPKIQQKVPQEDRITIKEAMKKEEIASEKRTPVLKAEDTYSKAIIEIKNVINLSEKNAPFTGKIECVEEIIDLISANNDEILILADRATPDIYLYGHCVNTCIFSVFLGKSLMLPKEKLLSLGFCAILNDIGMSKYLNLASKKEKLTESELSMLKKHPVTGQEIVQHMTEFAEDVKTLILDVMVQKQNNFSDGFRSNSVAGADIHEFAKIIAVADVYEALTHPRTHRDRLLPHDALKTMITGSDQEFDNRIIKVFIDSLSLYPPGSYVRLNTDEIAKVTGLNTGLPTRPKVKVIVSAENKRLSEIKTVNLSSTPMIFIKEAIDETKLDLADKKLMLELKAARWWVRGI
ncbi:MAG: hypothetical protein JW803_02695 [Endomicrobiales bacterium]|nr:hypothetical protein [Endomicrobiales bacterium]